MRLEPAAQSDWIIRACQKAHHGKRVGFSVLFALPKGMELAPLRNDDRQSVFVFHHGESAPEADLIISRILDGTTQAVESLDSGWFEERWIKDAAGKVVGIDARARLKEGGYWRNAMFFARDIAAYTLAPGQSPKTLDEIIDSACVAKGTTH